jgi:hypothetical protein
MLHSAIENAMKMKHTFCAKPSHSLKRNYNKDRYDIIKHYSPCPQKNVILGILGQIIKEVK